MMLTTMTRTLLRIAVMLLPVCTVADSVFAAARSVESVVAEKAQWPSYASANTSMTIEGRFSSIAGKQMRFRNCDLVLQSHDGRTLIRPSRDAENVEVYGRFGLVNTRPVFLIERLNEKPNDKETVLGRKRALREASPQEWYELGKWAAGRGAFYSDSELQVQAREANAEGLERERKALPADAVEPLVELSKKVSELGLPDSIRGDLIHESYQRRYLAVAKNDSAALLELSEEFAAEFDGAKVPLNPPQPNLVADYLKNPLDVYRSADAASRLRLHRILYVEILRQSIMSRTLPEGANGYQIAEEIDQQIPEDHAVAESLREREIAYRFKRIETATRQDALELSEELNRRKQPEKSRQVLEVWLKARTDRLRTEGPTGLIQAAEEYETLLKDKKTALALLVEAYELDSKSEAIAKRLTQHGYVLKGGRWLSKADSDAVPEDPVQMALREGRVVAGMTAEQVRKALGAPESLARAATSGEVNEIWTYANSSKLHLVIHLQRRGRTGEFKAVSVTQVKTDGK
ncbi:MAG: hypothetical protein AB7O26_07005 [Planctomycetaceae bacterium]